MKLKPVKVRFHMYGFYKEELMSRVDQYQEMNDRVANCGDHISALYPDISAEEWVDLVSAYLDSILVSDLSYRLVPCGDCYTLIATDSTGSRRIWTEVLED